MHDIFKDALRPFAPRLDFEQVRAKSTRFINCEVCQAEGRLLTNNGGPDDVDHGVCPACNGDCVVEVECEPITMEDLK